jgi:hypothetical protein
MRGVKPARHTTSLVALPRRPCSPHDFTCAARTHPAPPCLCALPGTWTTAATWHCRPSSPSCAAGWQQEVRWRRGVLLICALSAPPWAVFLCVTEHVWSRNLRPRWSCGGCYTTHTHTSRTRRCRWRAARAAKRAQGASRGSRVPHKDPGASGMRVPSAQWLGVVRVLVS